jgi:uncharacterized membrane protein YphA (DoxX/SURF4 family)
MTVARLRSWNRGLDEAIDLRALAVLRIAIGPIVLLHLRPFLAAVNDGVIYSDHFTLPFWAWYPELPRTGYVILLWSIAAAAVLLSLGLWTRVVAWVVFGGVLYNLLLSQTHFHHNRAFLIILLGGLAVLPAGRSVSWDAAIARRRGHPMNRHGGRRLALLVLRVEIATVYLASGFSKLIDPDWWGGTVTQLRVEHNRARIETLGLPDGLIEMLAAPGLHAVAAKVIVLTELFIGIGLLVPRLRKAAIWVAIPFHVSIQFTAAVQTFSVAALAGLVVWIDRPARSRRVYAGRRWSAAIRSLDWAGRFEVIDSAGGIATEDGGLRRDGAQARWEVLRLLPLTFWFAAPYAVVRRR